MSHLTRRSILSLCLIMTVMLIWLCGVTRAAAADASKGENPILDKHALILVSAAFGATATDRYVTGLLNGLKKGGIKSGNISIEYLNLARHMSTQHRQALATLLSTRYSGTQFDVVLCVQQPALDFLLNDIADLAPQATVFGWTAQLPEGAKAGDRQYVFQSTRLDYRGTLERALELFPGTERVIVMQGNSEVELSRWGNIREDLAPWKDRLIFEDTQALSAEEIETRLATAPKNTIVMGIGITRDIKGQIFVPPEFIARVVKTSKAPYFAVVDLGIEYGAIGGMVTRLGDDAAALSFMVVDVLRGTTKLRQQVTLVPSIKTPVFSWPQLMRWGANPDVLPSNSVFIDRPATLWSQYQNYVVASVSVLSLLVLLIIVMVLQNRRLNMTANALRKSEEGVRAVTQSAYDAIITCDSSGNVVGWNPGAQRIFGYGESEIMNQPMNLLMPEKFRERHRDGIDRVMTGGERRVIGKSVELSGLRKDGNEFPLELSLAMWETADGRYVTEIIRDITERKRAEDALQESEERYRKLFDTSIDAILLTAPDGSVLSANPAACRMFQRTEDEMRQLGRTGLVDITDPRLARGLEERSRTGKFQGELTFLRKDGSRFDGDVSTAIYRDKIQNLRTSMTIRDVTERKQAAEVLKRSEARFRSYFNQPMIGIAITSLEKGWLEVNPRLCEILGYPREEITHLTWAEITHPDDIAGDVAQFERVLCGEIDGYSIDKRFLRKDGGTIHVAMSVSCVRTEDGRVDYFVALIQDITERVLLETRTRESQKMEALGTLAGGVAHDFNNALAAILGNVELARQDLGKTHPALESLDEIAKAGRRAKNLVQQILAFGRRQVTQRRPMALCPIVQESARLLRTTLPAGVKLEVHCAQDVPDVQADATQIEQVLLNLCTNAWHALRGVNREGLIEIRLEAEDRDGERFACLTVRDNGRGMDEVTRARIFEPFFTTKAIGEGTGLGLSVVHGIVKDHRASVEVRSELGEGSSFIVHFPAARDSTAVSAGRNSPSAITGGDEALVVHGDGKSVLYIDDDESIVFLTTRLLERLGYRVTGFTDARAALAEVRARPGAFDLVVTDYNMPGISGLEVARALKEIRPDLPVALASGYITDELRAKAPEAGVLELIYKPDSAEELCRVVTRLAHAVVETPKSS